MVPGTMPHNSLETYCATAESDQPGLSHLLANSHLLGKQTICPLGSADWPANRARPLTTGLSHSQLDT